MALSGGGICWHGPGPGGAGFRQDLSSSCREGQGMTENTGHCPPREASHSFPLMRGKRSKKQWDKYPWSFMYSGGQLLQTSSRTWLWVCIVLFLLCPFPGLGPSLVEGASCDSSSCPSSCQCTAIGNTGLCKIDCSSQQVSMAGLNSVLSTDAIGELILNDCSISSIASDAFQDYPNLVKLDLTNNKLFLLDKDVFQPLTNLEVLYLSGNTITLPSGIFAGRSSLKELSLAGNSLDRLPQDVFKDIVALEKLDLSNNALTRIPYNLFTNTKSKIKMNPKHSSNKTKDQNDDNKDKKETNNSPKNPASETNQKHKQTVESIVVNETEMSEVETSNISEKSLPIKNKSSNSSLSSSETDGEVREGDEVLQSTAEQNSRGSSTSDERKGSGGKSGEKGGKGEKEKPTHSKYLSLIALDLSGNPWHCDCAMGQVIAWYQGLSSQGKAQNTGSTKCQTPASASNTKWKDLDVSTIDCDKSALLSCLEGISTPIEFQFSHPAQVTSRNICDKKCAQTGKTHGLFQNDFLCFCGASTTSGCTCPQTLPQDGDSICSKTYISGAFQTSMGLLLGPTQPTSYLDDVVLSAQTNMDTEWNFGDGSSIKSTTGGQVHHSYMLSGDYDVQMKLPNVGAGTTLTWRQKVDSDVVARLEAPEYSNAQANLDLKLYLDQGTDASVRWKRLQGGKEVLGKTCQAGWLTFRLHTCLKANYITSNGVDYTTAKSSCEAMDAKLLTIASASRQSGIISTLSSEFQNGRKFLLDAYKVDNATYAWKSDNSVPYFNVSMVQHGDNFACVALGSDGLHGVDCNAFNGYLCQTGQVFCEFGGEELNEESCFLSLGFDEPLSWTEAEQKCQTYKGHLAKVDTAEKENHIRTKTLGSQVASGFWLGLNDHQVSNYFTWTDSASLASSYAPWDEAMPIPSSHNTQRCAQMQNISPAKWSTADCNIKMPYICEYPTGGRNNHEQQFVAGTIEMTQEFHSATKLKAAPLEELTTSEVIIIPGMWFQHQGRVQSFRFVTNHDISLGGKSFRLQVYKPFCSGTDKLVPPGCEDLPSPYATCASSSVSCPRSVSECPAKQLYCPLSDKCVPLKTPCTCARADPATAASCIDALYNADGSQTTSTSYTYGGLVPMYALAGEVIVFLPDTATKGLYVIDAGDIQVEEDYIIGVQFINGTKDILCEASGPGLASEDWRQTIRTLSLPKEPDMQRVDVNGGLWMDNYVCNIQAVYTKPTIIEPNENLVHKSVHTIGEYTYRATVRNSISSIELEKKVIMQLTVLGLTMANPEAKFPKKTMGGSKLAVVRTQPSIDLLWYITRGTDASVNSTLSSGVQSFSNSCPNSLKGSVSTCSRSYQFYSESLKVDVAEQLTTVGITAWNEISSKSLVIDILAQDPITDFEMEDLTITEFTPGGKTIDFVTSKTSGSGVAYEWDFGDGTKKNVNLGTQTHKYMTSGFKTVKVRAANYLGDKVVQQTLKLVREANVRNLQITAPSEVDMENDFDIDIAMDLDESSSVTVLIEFGDGNSKTIDEPEIHTSSKFTINHKYRYATGNTYIITCTVVDNLKMAKVSEIPSMPAQNGVSRKQHTLLAWTLIKGMNIESSSCQGINTGVSFKLNFPSGFSKSGRTMKWAFGDGREQTKFEGDRTTHTYSNPNSYKVRVEVSNNNSKGHATYTKCIEEPIKGLTLTPKQVTWKLIKDSSVSSTYNVNVNEGSNLKYRWEYDGKTSSKSPSQYYISHTEPGTKNVRLRVYNKISSEEKEAIVHVVEVVDSVSITHNGYEGNYFRDNVEYDLTALAEAGSELQYTWTINSPGIEKQKPEATKTGVSWSSVGSFNVKVTVSNTISVKDYIFTAHVQKIIPAISITQFKDWEVDVPLKLGVGETEGTDKSYVWEVCNPDCTNLPDTDRTATFTPTKPGEHLFKVRAHNKVSHSNATLSLSVWNPLKNLVISSDDVVNTWAKKDKSITFTVELESGIAKGYNWTITDRDTNLKVWETHTSGSINTVDVILTIEAKYKLSVTAYNPIDVLTSKDFIFNLQEAIEGYSILPLYGDVCNEGERLEFKVGKEKGSYTRYQWSITTPPGLSLTLPSIKSSDIFGPILFTTAGEYTISLRLYNKVSDVTSQLKVVVQTPDPNIKIKIDYASDPYVHQHIPVDMSVIGVSKTETKDYVWSFYVNYPNYPPMTRTGLVANYNFSLTGDFIIEARFKMNSIWIIARKIIFVQGKLPPVTLVQDKKILSTGSSTSFHASVATSIKDLEFQWTIGEGPPETGTLSSRKINFNKPGVIRVHVLAKNKVSFSGDEVTVIVQDEISNLSLANCCYYNTTMESTLIAATSLGTNVTYKWAIQGVTFSREGREVTYTFPSVSKYVLNITATNLVSTAFKIYELYAQEPVDGLVLVKAPNQVYIGQEVVFKAAVATGSDITFQWRLCWGLFLDCDLSNTTEPTFTHIFKASGTFGLQLIASNDASRDTTYTVITSFEIRCKPMTLVTIGSTIRKEYKSKPASLEVEVIVNCTRYPVNYKWIIFKGDPSLGNEIDIGNINSESPVLNIPARTLDIGKYHCQFTAMYLRTPVEERIGFEMEVAHTSLYASIDGGTERCVSVLDDVTLDGSKSMDPDALPGDRSGLFFKWTLTDENSKSLTDDAIAMDQERLIIPAGKLTAGSTYLASLTVSKKDRAPVTTSQKLIIKGGKIPSLMITNINKNFESPNSYISSQPVKLKASCTNCVGATAFQWRVTRSDGAEIKINASNSVTGAERSHLIINGLDNVHSYYFTLSLNTNNLPTVFSANGEVKLKLSPNLPPIGGACNVILPDGKNAIKPLEDRVEVRCEGWTDPDGSPSARLSYEVYIAESADVDQGYRLYAGQNSRGYWDVPSSTSGDCIYVAVRVGDALGGKTWTAPTCVPVTPAEALIDNLIENVLRKLPQIVLHKNPRELLPYCTMISALLAQGQNNQNMTEEDITKKDFVISVLIDSLEEVAFSESLEMRTDIAYFLKTALSSKPSNLTEKSISIIIKFVNVMVEKFEENASPENSLEESNPGNMLSITTAVIGDVEAKRHPREQRRPKRSTAYDTLLATMSAMELRICKTCSMYLVEGQPAFKHAYDERSCYARVVVPKGLLGYDENNFQVRVPSAALPSVPVLNQVVRTQPKPLASSSPSSSLISIDFLHSNGTVMEIKGLDQTQAIGLMMPNSLNDDNSQDVPVNRTTLTKQEESIAVIFDTTNNTWLSQACGVNIEISGVVQQLVNETDYEAQSNLSMTAYLGLDRIPNWYSYDQKLVITADTLTQKGGSHTDYTFFVLLCVNPEVKKPHTISVVVTNTDKTHDVEITVSPYTLSCYYHEDSKQQWSTEGCRPTAASNRSHSSCEVRHLTLFGGSAILSPDDIDFSDLSDLNLADNPVVVILVSVIAGVFIVVVFWARQSDLQDLHNISVVPLCGRDGMYKYEVIVVTGRTRGAGTSAHVGIKIYGNEGKSGARHLARLGAFQRNSEDSFLVATDGPLGIIQKIHVWHDNTGKHPSWYVSRVLVRDLLTNEKYFFLVHSWLSLTVDRGSLDKQVFAASPEQLSNFGTIFSSEASRGFAERHVWLSIWDRPPRSRFTRVQRVVCCATLLYSFMCANVMWYGLINQPERTAQALGLVKIGWQDFVIGILASIVVFPINFIIIQIFRFSKVKVNAFDYGLKPGTAQTIEVEAMCDISQGGESFILYDRKNSIQRFHRQGSSDSIMVNNRLRRTEATDISSQQLVRSSTASTIRSDHPGSSDSRRREKQIPIEGKKWWSNDTILKWPENMPNDQRPDSSHSQGHAGPLKKTPAFRSMYGPKATDSCEELILDDDMFTAADREAILRENNNIRIVRKTTSQTLSINESIAEVDEDEYLEKYAAEIPMQQLGRPQPRERLDSWGTTASRFTLKRDPAPSSSKDSNDPNYLTPQSEPRSDSDSGVVNQALLEIDTNINESNNIEPRLLNKKKLSGNQGTTPNVDILRLDEFEHETTREMLDETAGPYPKSSLRKTRSKTKLSKRWAQIVIPPECEQYKNDSYMIFDPEDEYDAVSLQNGSFIKSRGNSLTSNITSSSSFHQLMPANLSTTSRCLLPHWCVYIAYSMCFLITGFSVIVTILYGHAFGKDLALKWLLAFFISFLDSVFILEPLKVLALAVFVAMITRGLQDEDEGIETRPLVEANEKIKDVRMKPLGGFALLQAREEGRKVQRMHRMLRHFCVYFMFLWISFFITYRAHNTNSYPVTLAVQQSFLVPSTPNGTSFYSIQRTEEMLSWMNTVALPAVYQKLNQGTNNQRILLGEARLRQIRGRLLKCHVTGVMNRHNANYLVSRGCYGDPGWHEETGHYSSGWKARGNGTLTDWPYSSAWQALGEKHNGLVDGYPGGGYVQRLGRTLPDAQAKLQSLVDARWLDRSTRAVFLEATLYTLPTYLHTTVRILVEFPVSGGVIMSSEVQSFMLQNFIPGQVTALMIFMALLSLICLYIAVVIVLSIRRHSLEFFQRFWNWIQILIFIVILAVIVLYAHCAVVDTRAYSRYASDPKGFNSFFYSVNSFRTWKSVTGILVFLSTLWLVRMMRFVKPLASYGKTLQTASVRLVGGSIILLIFLLGFTQLGHLWFGSVMSSFRSTSATFLTMFIFIRGSCQDTLETMNDTSPAMAGIFLFAFIATVLVVCMGLFMAILNSTYKTIRLQNYYHTSLDMQDHEMVEFMLKRFKKYIGITKPKPAFRRVKFQGMPSISSRSSMSSRTGMTHSLVSSGSYDAFGLDALEEENYLEELLERCVPTWNRMLEKLERVLWLDREITRMEKLIIERLGSTISKRSVPGLKHLQGLSRAAKVVGKVIGKGGSRCHRSNSESLMTDVRAKQIRDALNAELMEMEQKILADVETPSLPRKTLSFTEGRSGGYERERGRREVPRPRSDEVKKRDRVNFADPLEDAVLVGLETRDHTEIARERRDNSEMANNQSRARDAAMKPTSARPPLQPKRFLTSAGPRRAAQEVGLDRPPIPTRESTSSAVRRKGSAASSTVSRANREHSEIMARANETTKDAPAEAQKAYGSKLPRKLINIPGVNLTRRPTSEQSERVKKNPDLPLPFKHDS